MDIEQDSHGGRSANGGYESKRSGGGEDFRIGLSVVERQRAASRSRYDAGSSDGHREDFRFEIETPTPPVSRLQAQSTTSASFATGRYSEDLRSGGGQQPAATPIEAATVSRGQRKRRMAPSGRGDGDPREQTLRQSTHGGGEKPLKKQPKPLPTPCYFLDHIAAWLDCQDEVLVEAALQRYPEYLYCPTHLMLGEAYPCLGPSQTEMADNAARCGVCAVFPRNNAFYEAVSRVIERFQGTKKLSGCSGVVGRGVCGNDGISRPNRPARPPLRL